MDWEEKKIMSETWEKKGKKTGKKKVKRGIGLRWYPGRKGLQELVLVSLEKGRLRGDPINPCKYLQGCQGWGHTRITEQLNLSDNTCYRNAGLDKAHIKQSSKKLWFDFSPAGF